MVLTFFQSGEKLSSMIARPSYKNTWRELNAEKAMVFMAGPRQSGKTTLAQLITDGHANRLYFNWDIPTDRIRLIEQPFFFEALDGATARNLSSSLTRSTSTGTGKAISKGYTTGSTMSFRS